MTEKPSDKLQSLRSLVLQALKQNKYSESYLSLETSFQQEKIVFRDELNEELNYCRARLYSFIARERKWEPRLSDSTLSDEERNSIQIHLENIQKEKAMVQAVLEKLIKYRLESNRKIGLLELTLSTEENHPSDVDMITAMVLPAAVNLPEELKSSYDRMKFLSVDTYIEKKSKGKLLAHIKLKKGDFFCVLSCKKRPRNNKVVCQVERYVFLNSDALHSLSEAPISGDLSLDEKECLREFNSTFTAIRSKIQRMYVHDISNDSGLFSHSKAKIVPSIDQQFNTLVLSEAEKQGYEIKVLDPHSILFKEKLLSLGAFEVPNFPHLVAYVNVMGFVVPKLRDYGLVIEEDVGVGGGYKSSQRKLLKEAQAQEEIVYVGSGLPVDQDEPKLAEVDHQAAQSGLQAEELNINDHTKEIVPGNSFVLDVLNRIEDMQKKMLGFTGQLKARVASAGKKNKTNS